MMPTRDLQLLCRGLLLTHKNLILSNSFKYIHHVSRGGLEASTFLSQVFIYLHWFYFIFMFHYLLHSEAHNIQAVIGSFVRGCV